jgi:hypothetical protein
LHSVRRFPTQRSGAVIKQGIHLAFRETRHKPCVLNPHTAYTSPEMHAHSHTLSGTRTVILPQKAHYI